MQGNIKQRTRQTGFTLIELLIVIAIVAIIAAILFSVFQSARERGRRAACQSNLRQLSLAMQQYVQDNNGGYPPDGYQGSNLDGSPGGAVQWQDLLLPYVKETRLFYCPSAPPDAPGQYGLSQGNFYTVDYSYDTTYLNKVHRGVAHGVTETTIATPSTIRVYADPNWITPDEVAHYVRTVHTSCGRDYGFGTLHAGGVNYAFVDGHVKWLTPEAAGQIECTNPWPPKYVD